MALCTIVTRITEKRMKKYIHSWDLMKTQKISLCGGCAAKILRDCGHRACVEIPCNSQGRRACQKPAFSLSYTHHTYMCMLAREVGLRCHRGAESVWCCEGIAVSLVRFRVRPIGEDKGHALDCRQQSLGHLCSVVFTSSNQRPHTIQLSHMYG